MNVYEIGSMAEKLASNVYPGRGIVLGVTPDGKKAVDILPGDTPEVLQRRVMEEAEWRILPAATEQVCRQMRGE